MTGAVTEILASDWCSECHGEGGWVIVNRDGEPDDVDTCWRCDGHGFVTL